MSKTPEQKQASKKRKRQIFISALIIAKDLLASADIVHVYNVMDTHFVRLGMKHPQDKMLYIDVKVDVIAFLNQHIAPLKRKAEQKSRLEQEINCA